MPIRSLAVSVAISFAAFAASGAQTRIALWPRVAPDSESSGNAPAMVAGKPWTYVANVSNPRITVYSPPANNTGVAIAVFPGGGYNVLAIDLEGTEVCDWLMSKGITCVLLEYRVPATGPQRHADCDCEVYPKTPKALQDAQRALGLVRLHAAEWHIDPHKVGVLGFSAGGHLVADISNNYSVRAYPVSDAGDRQSARPDFAVAIYPGHLWVPGKGNPLAFNPHIHVTRNTPPTFLLQAQTDSVDGVNQVLSYYNALRNAGVPTEMHLYADGGHAFGLRRTKDPITEWPELVERWLRTIGMLK